MTAAAMTAAMTTGGFTVLMTLCTPETATVFSAGTSLYGVSDVKLLAEDTHKFESQYLFKLLGGTPEQVPEVYKARSAVYHADQIKAPLLVRVHSASGIVQLIMIIHTLT
jgi:dipeptidyl aminopeptidase/acylaminoacyl peptidase